LFISSQAVNADPKLYIATNKEIFSPAEKIQFQVFLISPSPKTNYSVFMELIDCWGNQVAKKMLPLNFNIASGDIDLPESVIAEFYLLYCYIVNDAGMESYSIKKIGINGNGTRTQQNIKKEYALTTYFEGGSFVAESPNNILLSCVDENDRPAIVTGKIIDHRNQVYAKFETNTQGLAKIKLNPEDKVIYYVVFKDASEQEFTSPLPVAASSGITLNVAVTETNIAYNLISYTTGDDRLPDYKIEAVYNQEIIYDAAISFQKGLSLVKEEIRKADFPAGFILFRLVDQSKKIIAQRTIYNPASKPSANFIRVVDTVNKKEVMVNLPDFISGKGYINIGFQDPGSAADVNTGFVDLSDKSLSFNDQLIAVSNPPVFMPENKNINRYLSLSGTLLNKDKIPLANSKVNLIFLYRNFEKQFLSATSDNKGKLQIDNLVFFDSVKVYYQLADKSEEKNNVFINFTITPSAGTINLNNPEITLLCAGNLKHAGNNPDSLSKDEKTLGKVEVIAEKAKTESEKFEEKYVSEQFNQTNMLRNKFDLIETPRNNDNVNVGDYIQGQIPNLKVLTGSDGSPIITSNSGGTVGVYLNDMLLDGTLSLLAGLQVKDIALIKYYSISQQPRPDGRNPFLDFRAGDGGSLYIYTKRDYSPDADKMKGLPKAQLRGYDLSSPVLYSNGPGSVFWKPDWNAENSQTIYIALPPGKTESGLHLLIEGINSHMLPYRFSQKLGFN
jgi:hypothetical protein